MKAALTVLLVTVLFVLTAFGDRIVKTIWLNDQRISCSNVFLTNGITITIDKKRYEIGFREDGIVTWRYAK